MFFLHLMIYTNDVQDQETMQDSRMRHKPGVNQRGATAIAMSVAFPSIPGNEESAVQLSPLSLLLKVKNTLCKVHFCWGSRINGQVLRFSFLEAARFLDHVIPPSSDREVRLLLPSLEYWHRGKSGSINASIPSPPLTIYQPEIESSDGRNCWVPQSCIPAKMRYGFCCETETLQHSAMFRPD